MATVVKIETRDCKTPGCAGEADARMGPYAGLCTSCTSIARKRLAAIQREASAKMTPEQRSERARAANQARHAPAASGVRDAMRTLERAIAERDKVRAVELKAADTYRDARKRAAAAEQKVTEARAALDRAIDGGSDEP